MMPNRHGSPRPSSFSFVVALLLLLGAHRPAQAQSSQSQLYQIYTSSATPSHYKRVIAAILQLPAPSTLTASGAATSASDSTPLPPPVDPGFQLRDFYIFPSPSKHDQKPTIRVQAGLADSVDVRIYDISGHRVLSSSLDAPQILDDGNGKGPQYTFDYSWDIAGVGSGVYLVVVTAHKAGQKDIRATKKVGVIR